MNKPFVTAVLGSGCFWCAEAIYQRLQGVESVQSGYMGGNIDHPTYEQVCTKSTGHIEVVQIRFNPELRTYQDLLAVFFATHDPTTVDRQGGDIGPQYASAIFYEDETQRGIAERALSTVQADFSQPIVTKLLPAQIFWPAEAYHDNYFELHPNWPYCALVISEKVNKFMQKFTEQIKSA